MRDDRRFRTTWPVLCGMAALALLSLPGPSLQAQDLTYTTVSRVEFGGAMGMMMRMVPDANAETRQTVFLKGTLMRTDDGDTSSIVDMADGRYTMLNHPDKTFYTVTMAQMQAQMEEAQDRMAEQNPMAQENPMAQDLPPDASFEVRMNTDRTGRTRNFDGYSAEQVLITMEMVPTSPEAEESVAMRGNTVIFTELWVSQDFPGADEYREAQERMGEAFMEGGWGEMAGGMGQIMMGNPNMKEAFEKNFEEMKDVEGVPVRTVAQLVMVPAGMPFDPDAVLAAEDEPLESDEMPSASEMARGAMGRRLGGLLGRRNQEQEESEEAGPTTQTITMRTTSTIQDIKTTPLSDDIFQPPAGYTERQPEWMRGG